ASPPPPKRGVTTPSTRTSSPPASPRTVNAIGPGASVLKYEKLRDPPGTRALPSPVDPAGVASHSTTGSPGGYRTAHAGGAVRPLRVVAGLTAKDRSNTNSPAVLWFVRV